MNTIETKEKGDIGLTQVIACLTENGIKVALPISEHLPFDLIAINNLGSLSRVSVKYRKLDKHGVIPIPLRTISSNSQGYKIKFTDFTDLDAFAIYCPDTKSCYFMHKSIFSEQKSQLSLRVSALSYKYKSQQEIKWAKDFSDPNGIFKMADR